MIRYVAASLAISRPSLRRRENRPCQQRIHVSLASPGRRENVEVLLEPATNLGFIHSGAPYFEPSATEPR